jgi:multidrug efflux pump subunit AcrA (membrane-fusion protein)
MSLDAADTIVCATALCGLAMCCLLLTGCGQKPAAEADTEAAAPVQVAVARRGTMHRLVTAEAVLSPFSQATIVPKISAPVKKFLAQRGDHVRQGQLLAVLEDRDLQAAARESQQQFAQAQATFENTKAALIPDDLSKAKSDTAAAQEGLDAAKKLYENRAALFQQGALAQKLVDDAKVALVQAQSQYDTARQHLKTLETVGGATQLQAAQAQMEASKAHYESSAAQSSYAEVRSPIAGVVADRGVNLGDMANSGSALFTVVDIGRVIAKANIPVQEAAALRTGDAATIKGEGVEMPGKVTVVSPAVDANTTTVQVWIEAANKGEKLKLGVTVQVSIEAGDVPDAVIVPAAALLASDDGGEKVMVAGADSTAHERKVETGVRDGDDIQLISGVKPGEKVIVNGGLGLDDKAKIQIADARE